MAMSELLDLEATGQADLVRRADIPGVNLPWVDPRPAACA